jgi:DNA polymerase-4
LLGIAERLEGILESKQLLAKTVTLKVKYSDFQLNTRSKTTALGCISRQEISAVLPELLRKTEVGKRPIRLIGISLANLHSTDESLALKTSSGSSEQFTEDPQLGLF